LIDFLAHSFNFAFTMAAPAFLGFIQARQRPGNSTTSGATLALGQFEAVIRAIKPANLQTSGGEPRNAAAVHSTPFNSPRGDSCAFKPRAPLAQTGLALVSLSFGGRGLPRRSQCAVSRSADEQAVPVLIQDGVNYRRRGHRIVI
jgi:hypothetical protein